MLDQHLTLTPSGEIPALTLLHRKRAQQRAKPTVSPFDFVAAPHTQHGLIQRRRVTPKQLAALPLSGVAPRDATADDVPKVLFPEGGAPRAVHPGEGGVWHVGPSGEHASVAPRGSA